MSRVTMSHLDFCNSSTLETTTRDGLLEIIGVLKDSIRESECQKKELVEKLKVYQTAQRGSQSCDRCKGLSETISILRNRLVDQPLLDRNIVLEAQKHALVIENAELKVASNAAREETRLAKSNHEKTKRLLEVFQKHARKRQPTYDDEPVEVICGFQVNSILDSRVNDGTGEKEYHVSWANSWTTPFVRERYADHIIRTVDTNPNADDFQLIEWKSTWEHRSVFDSGHEIRLLKQFENPRGGRPRRKRTKRIRQL